jgi:hypothetical protein
LNFSSLIPDVPNQIRLILDIEKLGIAALNDSSHIAGIFLIFVVLSNITNPLSAYEILTLNFSNEPIAALNALTRPPRFKYLKSGTLRTPALANCVSSRYF